MQMGWVLEFGFWASLLKKKTSFVVLYLLLVMVFSGFGKVWWLFGVLKGFKAQRSEPQKGAHDFPHCLQLRYVSVLIFFLLIGISAHQQCTEVLGSQEFIFFAGFDLRGSMMLMGSWGPPSSRWHLQWPTAAKASSFSRRSRYWRS